MSAYFQRLLRQSGVQLSASAPAVSTLPLPTLSPLASTAPLSGDVVEVHEEQLPAPSGPAHPSAPSSATLPFSSSAPQANVAPPAPAQVRPTSSASEVRAEQVVIQKTDTVETESISLTRPTPASKPLTVSTPLSASSTRAGGEVAPTPAASPISPELPAEIMQAVMKWIAAGSAPGTPAPAGARESAERKESAAAPLPATPPAAPTPREAPKIPERVIQIVEEHFDDAVPSPRPAPAAPAAASSAPQPPTFVSPPESPIHVSIGSIQVRVDAPAPPSTRVVRPAAPARSAAPAPRSNGLSQLRRHYIIPH